MPIFIRFLQEREFRLYFYERPNNPQAKGNNQRSKYLIVIVNKKWFIAGQIFRIWVLLWFSRASVSLNKSIIKL